MNENEQVDPWELELEAALRVEAAPEFLARVRGRVAAEPICSLWSQQQWGILAAAAVSAVIAGSALLTRDSRPSEVSPAASPIWSELAAPPLPEPATTASRDVPARRLPASAEPRSQGNRRPSIPRAELAAVQAFISQAQRGTFTYELADDAVPVPEQISPLAEIVVPPIALLPLDDGLLD